MAIKSVVGSAVGSINSTTEDAATQKKAGEEQAGEEQAGEVQTGEVQTGYTTASDGSRIPPPPNNSLRDKLVQLIKPSKVINPPAIRFEGDWRTAAQEICTHWIDSQAAHAPDKVSILALSRMKALEYERKHLAEIRPEDRLLPGVEKKDYHREVVRAFLDAVGEQKPDDVLNSFKLAGTGGLHRHQATVLTTVGNAVGAATILTPDPIAKSILAGIRAALGLATSHQIIASGERRMRNAQTEELMPLGRADAAPSAKTAPDLLQASGAVLTELWDAKKTLTKIETARNALQAATAARAAHPADPALAAAVGEARGRLDIAFARACYQIDVKSAYKAASESAKVEYIGNKRYFISSFASTGLTTGAGLFAILTPIVGAAATGGVSAAAAAIAAAIYVGYHLSSGASKDGEEKAKRAIVALAKSADVFSEDSVKYHKDRADAYRTYLQEKKAIPLGLLPQQRAHRKAEAKERLQARLRAIAEADAGGGGAVPTARQNWEDYRNHHREAELSETDADRHALAARFENAHKADFASKTIADAWKDPMRMRMETGRRLLAGKVAQAHKRLIRLHRKSLKSFGGLSVNLAKTEEAKATITAELRQGLLDLLNLELAARRTKQLADGGDAGGADLRTRAQDAIAAIQDEDFQQLFCGDAKAQVEAGKKAKKLTAGELERYYWPNLGNAVFPIALNTALMGADTGIHAQKAQGTYHGPQFADYKFAMVQNTGAPVGAHQNAGSRAKYQGVDMKALLDITTSEGPAVALRVRLAEHDPNHFTMDAVDMDAVMARLLQMDAVPDSIVLTAPAPAVGTSASANKVDLKIDLDKTAAFHRVRYKNAPVQTRVRFNAERLATGARQMLMTLGGLPMQQVARSRLKTTRDTLNRMQTLHPELRGELRDEPRPHGEPEIAHPPATTAATLAATITVDSNLASAPEPRPEIVFHEESWTLSDASEEPLFAGMFTQAELTDMWAAILGDDLVLAPFSVTHRTAASET
ncbi:hypothetical protein D3870_00435 [Noviherbaspirillum cavernae]|uniref:Type III effector protein n=1 Tax=Noviherbaspirillum cavernae TaxID=2320862 RepID=A0A418WWR7_9BURK|nr:hypothetical protein [Noviherbaspirillum cavernae]RJG04690.1 hypothetical protein D3870_00435 [Noviherbaspirillum cavernae]